MSKVARRHVSERKLRAYAEAFGVDLAPAVQLAPCVQPFMPSSALEDYLVPIPPGAFVGMCFDGPFAGYVFFDREPVVDMQMPTVAGNINLLKSVGVYEYSGYGSWIWVGRPNMRWRVNWPVGG